MRRQIAAAVSASLFSGSVILYAADQANAESVIRWETPTPAETFDPYGHDVLSTYWVQELVFEYLVQYDQSGLLEPGLAKSWRPVDPTTWELELRRGVKFHDGTPFTSADVVFSFKRGKGSGSTVAHYLGSIANIEAIDADTVRVTIADKNPIPWDDLSSLLIMSRTWSELHHAEMPSPVGDDRWDYAETHANGTGPFMLEELDPGEHAVLVRNPTWWKRAPGTEDIAKIVQTRTMDLTHSVDRLLAGELDVLQNPPPEQLDRIDDEPSLKVQKFESVQTLYLGFNQWSLEAKSSDIKRGKPFRDRRVRQAIYHAINIERVLEAVHGLGVPIGMLIWPKAIGWSAELDLRLPYDLAKARELLSAAGYSSGFSIRFDCYEIREELCESIGTMLDQIGIKVELALLPISELNRRIQDRTSDLFTFGEATAFDSLYIFRSRYRSDANLGSGYFDPKVDALNRRDRG